MSIKKGKDTIAHLVQHFRDNYDLYHSDGYKETQVRQDLIDPLFIALGWDVRYENKAVAPDRREVILEQSQEIEGATKQADYAFRFGKETQFFVEAKRPRVKIAHDIEAAYQLRRYGWTAKLPLSILTNFEDLAIYDCRLKPNQNDNPDKARNYLFTYREYPDQWETIWDIFSRDAVWGGGFDKFAQSNLQKHGTSEVDVEFLKTIEGWRLTLANSFAHFNPGMSIEVLNDVVQRTIDRIIFLRMAEDRGIEKYGRLKELAENPPPPAKGQELRGRIYLAFMVHCNEADRKFNAGLFDLSKTGDRITPTLSLPDDVLRSILANLYYPECPYNFRQLPVEILGSVYERFLGKVIRLTASGKQAKVEDKPDVKKAGGVYYTPSYIVNEIVENSVGKWIEHNVKPDARQPLPDGFRILDCACGSGSFLLGAYQYLQDYYLNWYLSHDPVRVATQKVPPIYRAKSDGTQGTIWRLTIAEKKRILTNHIFGVDIDGQAVEVTKLSLLLKQLEEERGETIQLHLGERLLPSLERNVRRGNSLIDMRMYMAKKSQENQDHLELAELDPEELKHVRPFDWVEQFPDAMKSGGFDVVIGNPPYIRIQTLQEWAPLEVAIYKSEYEVAKSGNYDIYVVFVERGLGLLKQGGHLGFILPHKFFNAQYGQPVRKLISTGQHLAKVIHFGDQQVFENASTYTCLMFLEKDGTDKCHFEKVDNLVAWRQSRLAQHGDINAVDITDGEWNFTIGTEAQLFKRLMQMPLKLENATDRIFQGIKTSADAIYIVEEIGRDDGRVQVFSKAKDAEYWLEPDLLHPLVKGGDSRRYRLSRTSRLILFPYVKGPNGKAELIPEAVIKSKYPMTWAYLSANKHYLEERENGKMRGTKWYGYIYPKALDVMPLPKIFTPDIAARAAFSLDPVGDAFFTGGVSGGYGILVSAGHSREYILGLLNSKLLEWIIRRTATSMRGGYYSYEARFIRNLPIHVIDPVNKEELALQNKLISQVNAMLSLNEQFKKAETQFDRQMYESTISATDRQIDELVYELYGLSEDEIKIVNTIV